MNTITVAKVKGDKATVDIAAIDKLRGSLRGSLLQPGDSGYDQARTLWNAMIDRKPAIIVRCAGVSDIIQAVKFTNEYGLLTAVKGGGHNIAGNGCCDGGLMIDLSLMRSVRVDPRTRTVHAEPGAALHDVDIEMQAFGMVTPLGINSTTGISGFTLGGGFGWLSRKFGMTVDNLAAADIITADGKFLHVSEKENSDLFWAIRGGGGNFGVVTRFEYRLYPINSEVLAGLIIYPLSEAGQALRKYRDFVKKMGKDTNVWVVLRQAPPLPFIPTEYHGKNILAFGVIHTGDINEGQKVIEPVRNFGNKIAEHSGPMPYSAWQTAFDPLLTPGARNYWKSHNFADLSDEVIDLAIEYTAKLPSPHTEIVFALLGGAVNSRKPDATAYSHRDTDYVLNVHGRWEKPEDDEKCIAWARSFFQATAPYASGGVYVNFMTAEETERVKAAYGPNYERLVEIKKKYDPKNLFRMNQNINPPA